MIHLVAREQAVDQGGDGDMTPLCGGEGTWMFAHPYFIEKDMREKGEDRVCPKCLETDYIGFLFLERLP